MPIVAPSLLSANFLQLQQDCDMLNSSEAAWWHLDIMDGRFVPNISYGPMIVKFIRSTTKSFCDVHLMIEEPEKFIDAFVAAGADQLTVHWEACIHLHRTIQQIKSCGIKAGVAVNPHTPVHFLKDIIGDVDTVLVMSVNPGFGGQLFLPHTLNKVTELRQMITQQELHTLIEVDGGVNTDNAKLLVAAGADVLVAGNTVFAAADPKAMIARLKMS